MNSKNIVQKNNQKLHVYVDFEATTIDDDKRVPYVMTLCINDKGFSKVYDLSDVQTNKSNMKDDILKFIAKHNPNNLKTCFVSGTMDLEKTIITSLISNDELDMTFKDMAGIAVENYNKKFPVSQSAIEKLLNIESCNSLQPLMKKVQTELSENEYYYLRLRKTGRFVNGIGQVYHDICIGKETKGTVLFNKSEIEDALIKYNRHDVESMKLIYRHTRVRKVKVPEIHISKNIVGRESYEFMDKVHQSFHKIKNSKNLVSEIEIIRTLFINCEKEIQEKIIQLESELNI